MDSKKRSKQSRKNSRAPESAAAKKSGVKSSKASKPEEPSPAFTVLHSRSLSEIDQIQSKLLGVDGRVGDIFLQFVRESSNEFQNESELLSLIAKYTFATFPQATNFVLVTWDDETHQLTPLLACSRSGEVPPVPLSTTLVRTVIDEGVSLLYSEEDDAIKSSESLMLSRINTAICAPLFNREKNFGVIQLDIRKSNKGSFGSRDVDLLVIFANHVSLVLDNFRLYREQYSAFESTINALIHSLSLKDPDTASHSERVQAVAVYLGRKIGIGGAKLEALSMAALLHDMGKHGIKNEVLKKPARLTSEEQKEMAKHTEYTQSILDKICFPAHLKEVPMLAAYHHEKMDGSGPYGLKGQEIPIQSRIVAIADVFDALTSKRVYKEALPVPEVIQILMEGKGRQWDPAIVNLVAAEAHNIMSAIYRMPKQVDDLDDSSGQDAKAA